MIWYLENPQRFRAEREALERLISDVPWLSSGAWRVDDSLRLIWDADITTGDRVFPVMLRFPNHYPHSPPLVLPRGETGRWSSHQYGPGGELCTEFGPDNWHPDITGVDMIQSAHRLLSGETSIPGGAGIIPSRHSTTLGQDLRNHGLRLIVTRELRDFVATLPERIPLRGKLVTMYHRECAVFVVASIVLPDGTEWSDKGIPGPTRDEAHEREVLLIRLPETGVIPSSPSATAMRIAAVGEPADAVPFLIVARGDQLYVNRLWEDDTISEVAVVPAQSTATRAAANRSALLDSKVAVVGCGSVGSKIATMLARAGVGKFLLVDDDLFLPENLIRHDLDWRDIGAHKSDAIGRRIQLVNSGAKCEVRRHHLGGQESGGSIETLIESLASCDLIVNATADERTSGYLDAAVSTGAKPLVWAEVFGGGIGGIIARHRPGLEPDPASMRRKIDGWCRDQGRPIERAIDYETNGSGPPLIADDADVTVVAAHAARLAIDTLLSDSPSNFPYSVYLIGMTKGWIFEQPFDTRPIDVGGPDERATPTADPALVADELARVLKLFQRSSNAPAADAPDRQTPAA